MRKRDWEQKEIRFEKFIWKRNDINAFLVAERTLHKIMAASQMDDMRYCPELSIVFFPKSGHFFWRFLHPTMKPFFNPTEKAVREIRCSVCGKVFVFRFWTAGFFYALQIEVR